ncbi:MAG TPA: glycosyltransferase family 87 protein [Gemmatimonadales bacterium]|nr:glycosyltransferase family 87 protein [Gemmatimonadales bacterium]
MSDRTERRLLVAALVLYGLIAVPTGIRRGTDFAIHIPIAQAWLARMPLYESAPHVGMWWPPFAIVLVAPFAALATVAGLAWAKAAWGVVSLACLGWALDRLSKDGWRTVAVALLAVAVPLHRNFEDLNLNAFLLALWVAAARDVRAGRDTRAAMWIGTAAAIKVYPGLLLAYFVLRRRLRPLAFGIGTAAALTALPLLAYGVSGAAESFAGWTAHGTAVQASLRGSNQSLAALATRLHLPLAGFAVLELSCLGVALMAALRWKHEARPCDELAVLALAAVLLSPIAWVHYFLLALPAWLTALRLGRESPHPWLKPALFLAAVGTSGVLTVFSLSLRDVVFGLSLYTWGGLVLLLLLAFAERGSVPKTAAAYSG